MLRRSSRPVLGAMRGVEAKGGVSLFMVIGLSERHKKRHMERSSKYEQTAYSFPKTHLAEICSTS